MWMDFIHGVDDTKFATFPLNFFKKKLCFTSNANTQKGTNENILQKDCESFLILFHFFI